MTSFGEIVEPGSRAAWEDWDDNAEHEPNELKWHVDLESPGEIDVFVILEGKYLADNIKAQALNLELVHSIPEVNLQLYRSTVTNRYICTVLDYNLVLSSQIVELLRQYLIVSRFVIAIQTKPLPEYQSSMPTSSCIIREVTTVKKQSLGIKSFPKLEQPNMISGVAAGVVSLREHLGDCGTALVAFLENTEEYNAEEMELLLEQLNISKTKNRTSSILNSNFLCAIFKPEEQKDSTVEMSTAGIQNKAPSKIQ